MKATKIALLSLLLPLAAHAKSPWRVPVNFSVTTNTGVGYSMFVVGNHPDLGEWNPLKAVPLAWHEGNVWSAEIGIQAGTELEYKYLKRPTNASEYPDGDKTEWWPNDNLSLTVPSEPPAPFEGKRVVFRCPFLPFLRRGNRVARHRPRPNRSRTLRRLCRRTRRMDALHLLRL